jgi:hypothetical protein
VTSSSSSSCSSLVHSCYHLPLPGRGLVQAQTSRQKWKPNTKWSYWHPYPWLVFVPLFLYLQTHEPSPRLFSILNTLPRAHSSSLGKETGTALLDVAWESAFRRCLGSKYRQGPHGHQWCYILFSQGNVHKILDHLRWEWYNSHSL